MFRSYCFILRSLVATVFIALFFQTVSAEKKRYSVYFPSNCDLLNRRQMAFLDSLAYFSVIDGGMRIFGYAGEGNSVQAKKALAMQRATSVRDWFLDIGYQNISIIELKGEALTANRKDPLASQRVDIEVDLKNPLEETQSSQQKKPAEPELQNLEKLEVNQTIEIRNLLFVGGSAEFLPESIPVLDELYKVLASNPGMRVGLEGHICCGRSRNNGVVNPKLFGFDVSNDRAKAVYDYLINKGIAPGRLEYSGFGFARPIVFPERTEEDRKRNRRVEVRLLENQKASKI